MKYVLDLKPLPSESLIQQCVCAASIYFSGLVSYRENRPGLIEYNHRTGGFVQLVLLRRHVCFLLLLVFELQYYTISLYPFVCV